MGPPEGCKSSVKLERFRFLIIIWSEINYRSVIKKSCSVIQNWVCGLLLWDAFCSEVCACGMVSDMKGSRVFSMKHYTSPILLPVIFLFFWLSSLSTLCILPATTCNTQKYLNLKSSCVVNIWFFWNRSDISFVHLHRLTQSYHLLVGQVLSFIFPVSVASKDALYFSLHLFRLLACMCTKGVCCSYGDLIISYTLLEEVYGHVLSETVHSECAAFTLRTKTQADEKQGVGSYSYFISAHEKLTV